MAIVEIRLEGGSLDLLSNSEKEFYITKQIHDLRDLNTRNASFSKTITIPRNENNVRLLASQMPDFASYGAGAYTFLDCQVLMGGWPVLVTGKLFVESEELTGKTLSINVFGGVVGFFEGLTDLPIGSLEWSEFNFEWSLANMQSYVNTTEGFLFGQCIWFENKDWEAAQAADLSSQIELDSPEIRTNGGWVYVKTIVDKILALQPGINFDISKLTSLDLYDKMVLCIPVTQMFNNFKATTGFYGYVEQLGETLTLPINGVPVRAVFPEVQHDSPAGFWDAANNEFAPTVGAFYDIRINLNINGFGPPLILGFGVVEIWVGNERVSFFPVFGKQEEYFELSRFVSQGEKVYITFKSRLGGDVVGWDWSGNFEMKGSTGLKNDFVNLGEWFPDISQRDFIKEVFKFFNAIPTYENGVVSIDLWDEIPNQEPIDLTEYLDTSKSISLVGEVGTYAQNNTFKYTNHETVTFKGTDFTWPMLSDNLPLIKDVITSKFSASDQSLASSFLFGAFPLFPLSFRKVAGNKITTVNGSAFFTSLTEHRLEVGDVIFVRNATDDGFQGRRRVASIGNDTDGTVDVAFTEGATADWEAFRFSKQEIGLRFGLTADVVDVTLRDGGSFVAIPNMKAVTFPGSLNWKELAAEHYDNLTAILRKPTVAQAWFRLPNVIFHNLTLLQPVYVNAKTWYLNKIEQYNWTRPCRIELIEIKRNVAAAGTNNYFVSAPGLFLGNWGETLPAITQEYLVFNNGDFQETIDIAITGGTDLAEWSIDKTQIVLGLQESEKVTLTFAGSVTLGTRLVDLDFIDQDGLEFTRPAQVDVLNVATYTVSVNPIDWGDTSGNNIQMDTIITNTGLLAIEFDLTAITGDTGNFAFVAPTPGGLFTLNPGATQSININYSRQGGNGVKTAQFSIEPTTANAIDTLVNLTATAV